MSLDIAGEEVLASDEVQLQALLTKSSKLRSLLNPFPFPPPLDPGSGSTTVLDLINLSLLNTMVLHNIHRHRHACLDLIRQVW